MSSSTVFPAARDHSVFTGIACVAGGIFFLTLSDANAKWLGTTYNPLQILFLRALIALPFVTALAVWLADAACCAPPTPACT